MTGDLSGKVVLVTGAGRGIGRGVAEVLAEAGADVALNALTPRHLEPAAAAIAASSGRRVVPLAGDVTTGAGARQVVAAALEAFDRIDVLVNATGGEESRPLVPLPGEDEDADELADAELRQVLDINLTATIRCTQAVGRHLLDRGSGQVINIASLVGRSGGGRWPVYTAAKTGLEGFTRALALQWAPHGIRVNAIAPGIFPDPVTLGEERAQAWAEAAKAFVPVGRAGRVREVGLLAAYLASAESDYMTGQVVYLDGGWSINLAQAPL